MQDYVNDLYAPLAHIPELRDARRPRWMQSWVSMHDTRRLAAYNVLGSYRSNTRRFHLPQTMWLTPQGGQAPAEQMREYGDAALFVDTARSLLLGDEQTLRLPDDAPAEFLTWLEDWAVKERLTQKLLEGEEHSIGDGDGVYVLGWSRVKNRPTLRVIDPGFYFPDLDAAGADVEEFPTTVHVAWEWKDDTTDRVWIRRQTWTLGDLEVPVATSYGETRQATCWYRSVDYDASELDGRDVYAFDLTKAEHRRIVSTDGNEDGWIDLGVDFIPVVHVPNDPSTQRTFGRALLLRISMLLDDLSGNDTDLVAAAQNANPALATTGVDAGGVQTSGMQLAMPTGGSAAFIDTSKNLDALVKFSTELMNRLSINSRLSLSLIGKVQPDEVPSGYALELGFHPARQLLREMRTVRDEKYPLILKFAMRLAQTYGALPAGATPAARIELGASLPADKPAAIETVKDLLPVHGISTPTAVKILVDAGLPIEDATAEVNAIKAEWFDAMVKLVDATGDTAAARQVLGLPEAAPLPTTLVVPDPSGEQA